MGGGKLGRKANMITSDYRRTGEPDVWRPYWESHDHWHGLWQNWWFIAVGTGMVLKETKDHLLAAAWENQVQPSHGKGTSAHMRSFCNANSISIF